MFLFNLQFYVNCIIIVLFINKLYKEWIYKIDTNVKKIAGRYPYEGIFKMLPGDKISVKRSKNEWETTYIAVQADNEMFLIKKTRE